MPRPAPRLAPVTTATLLRNDPSGWRSDKFMAVKTFRESRVTPRNRGTKALLGAYSLPMTVARIDEPIFQRPLRLWPGVAAVALQWLFWLVMPAFCPEMAAFGIIGRFFGAMIIIIWWLFF